MSSTSSSPSSSSSSSSSSCSHPAACWFVLLLFFLLMISSQQLSVLRSAEAYQQHQSCAGYHSDCGNVTIHYPFSDPGREECGLGGIIDCVDNSAELTISSSKDDYPHRFEVKSINYVDNMIVVHDRLFTKFIAQNKCDALYNFSLPRPSSSSSVPISFHLIQPPQNNNITFQICEERFTDNTSQHDYHGLKGVRICGKNHVLHFFDRLTPNKDSLHLKYGCKLVEFPADLFGEANNVVDRLSKGFRLQWVLSTVCQQCHQNNTLCLRKDNQGQQLLCADADANQDRNKSKVKRIITIGVVSAAGGILLICLIFFLIKTWYSRGKSSQDRLTMAFWRKRKSGNRNVEAFLRNDGSLAPKRYSYADIKKMTNSFKEKLGQGGYGSVFKGKLADGRLVAVKVLKDTKGNGEEFINEVATIGRTFHLHIVTFLGFCLEGSKKALIYEFMSNGSLEKFIYDNKSANTNAYLGWDRLYQIAICIAKGLEYLHGCCNTQIVHFDIKPHNILLDENFCPKISDFGLAKLCPPKDSIISMAEFRGTIGYIAPEVFSRHFGRVSSKSDIYSYGMMILEIVGGRKNFDKEADPASENYFPDLIYEHVRQNENLILDIVMMEEEERTVRKMILVGLWCIQTDPKDRPSIRKVVEMLEGNLESLPVPPKPFLSSPSRQLVESFCISTS